MVPKTPFSTPLSGSAKMTERRIRNIFQGQRKRPPVLVLILGALVILLCGSLVSCQIQEATAGGALLSKDVTLYEAGGMTIAFPNDIYDQLVIFSGEDENTLVSVYERASYEEVKADWGEDAIAGGMFAIVRRDQAQYEQFWMNDRSGQSFFARDEYYYYGWFTPTDVQRYRTTEEEWDQLYNRALDIQADFIQRNGLTPYDDSEFSDREFVYEGEHLYAAYTSGSLTITMTLSQPVTQGGGGIWCVEQWHERDDRLTYAYSGYSFSMEGRPQEQGISAMEHYQQLQDAADAGARPELLNPRLAALVWLQNCYSYISAITVTLGDVTLLEGNPAPAGQAPALSAPDARTAAFAAVLEDLYYDHVFPDASQYDSFGSDPTWTDFAVYDVDGDGRQELILRAMDTYTAGQRGLVYDFDEASGTVREQFSEFPRFTFYSNGAIRADASHNQGWGGDFWPYTLYQYEPNTDSYQLVGMVDAWDKSLSDENPDVLPPFPSELDVSGTGFLYYLYPAAVVIEGKPDPVDASVYHAWLDPYLAGAQELELPYTPLTEESVAALKNGAL